ncbi:MAG TPA: head GIN domain-containing protein [Cellulomonadaceae bacterium]|nr:head GIN domain-containing protein [Cellulomonadaceae bacterium]
MTVRSVLALTAATVGVLMLALAGCGPSTAGPSTTDLRTVGTVSAVRLASAGSLTIEHGDVPSLTVTAPENVLPHVTSDVRDGVLVLDVDSAWVRTGGVTYHLVVDDLDEIAVDGSGEVAADAASGDRVAITVRGSGHVEVARVTAPDVTVTVAGSGDVSLAGRTDHQRVLITGSGTYAAEAMTSRTADVDVAGSGCAELDASEALTVAIAGSGSVTHTGQAVVTSRVQGSGRVVGR